MIITKIRNLAKKKLLFTKIDEILCFNFKFYKIKYIFYKIFKINKYKIVFDNFQGKGYADNPKYIAEELHNQFPEFKIIWLYNFLNTLSVDFPDYIIPVHFQSSKALYHLATAKFWVFNYRPFWQLPKRNKQIYIQTWHGSIGPKMIEKDAEKYLDKAYVKRAIYDSSKISVCISGSGHLSNIYKNSFWYNGKILEVGSPRNDILFNQKGKDEILKKLGIKNKKVCLYAPTFRNDYSFKKYNLDFKRLKTFLDQKTKSEWIILIRFHPHLSIKSLSIDFNDVINVSSYSDAQELLLISDILITDYSSIIFDFCNLYRPAFIYAPDYSSFINDERPVYFKLEETPFPIAKTNDILIENINSLDMNDYETKVKTFLKEKQSFDNGHASEKTVEYILSKIN